MPPEHDQDGSSPGVLPGAVLSARSSGGEMPLSFAQQRMWFLNQYDTEGDVQNNVFYAVELSGPLQVDVLRDAFQSIARRHASLRTRFSQRDGVPYQIVDPPSEIEISLADIERSELQEWIDSHARHVFDLERGPLWKADLLRVHASRDATASILSGERNSAESTVPAQEHVLLITMHHTVCDGPSFRILFSELAALYNASLHGERADLPDLPVQYTDYARWERQRIEEGRLEGDLAYWKERLRGAPELLSLPTDRPRPAVAGHAGRTLPFQLPEELSARLKELRHRQRTSLFKTLLAAFQVLMWRYSQQTDMVVGTPVSVRKEAALANVMGFFINTIPFRTAIDPDERFSALLARVTATVAEGQEHQEIPFDYLVNELSPQRSLEHNPIVQVVFALQREVLSALDLKGIEARRLQQDNAAARFDVTLSVYERRDDIIGYCEYRTDLFDRATIERMLEHFRRLLEAIVANPEERVSRYELLTEEERQQVVVEWNRNERAYPQGLTLHGLFEAQAECSPEAIALTFEGAELSYRALNARANRLARYLIAQGVGPEVRVGICLERSLDMIIALLGVLKAGGAYVPLDPNYPKARLDYIAADAQMQCILTHSHLRERVGGAARCVCVDEQESVIAQWGDDTPAVPVRPENLAYVIHTSGSTGQPKGVAIEHQSPVTLVHWASEIYSRRELAGVLAATSICFDLSVYEIFVTLANGGTIILVSNALGLVGRSNEPPVTLVNTVPSAMEELVRLGAIPDSVQTINLAGEPLSPALVDKIYDHSSTSKVYDLYGPSEDTTYSTYILRKKSAPQSIGRPIRNTQVYILDRYKNPQPIGVPGELYIAGEGLARGYLNRPGLTAETFVPNPFGTAGSRMYRTGDLARYRPDGRIEFLGRLDHQVKIRGFRIELGEIEATLARHPRIAKVLVVASGEGEAKHLVAYYTLKAAAGDGGETKAPEPADLRELLRETLPEHMVPGFFVSLNAFPLTPNGKIDRAALPAPDLAGALAKQYAAPRTSVEGTIAGVWQQVLHIPQVGVHDNFFEIGGHSLLATQAISRINDAFSLALPVRVLFEAPNIEDLAHRVESAQGAGRIARLPLVPIARSGPVPPSFAQQRVWFMCKFEGPSFTYNVSVVVRLRGPLDEDALVRALQALVARHEVLRTRFRETDGAPMQVIESGDEFVVRRQRLSAANTLTAVVDEELHYPFDLSRDSLFRALLIEEGPEAHELVLNLHHSISDGWSMGVLMKDLTALYAAFRAGRPSPLPPLVIQYADFAQWQREWLTGEVLAAETAYWKQALANLPPLLELPTDRPRPPVQSYRGDHEPFRLSKALTDQLIALSQTGGTTLFMTLLAAFDILLSRYSGQADIAVATPAANRTHPELEPLIGFFINTLVLRADLSGDPTFMALLNRTREVALNAYAHQDVPFEYLVEQLNPARSLSYAPLFQVMLVMQNPPPALVPVPDLEVTPRFPQQRTTKVDLTLSLRETAEGLSGWLEYSTDLFDRSTVQRLLDHYRRLLEAVVDNPEERISRYEILSEEERRQLVVDWNRNQQAYPREQTMHGLLEAQAERVPDALALVFEGKHLTYGAVNSRANQLAHYLIAHGVGPEVRVGLCLERSLDMMIAILGVLKAGGAYVPLDPSYPRGRLDYLVDDAKVQCVVTEARLRDRVSDGVPVVCLDEVRPLIAQQRDDAPMVPVLSQNLAYVIHTSGSTGHPKGVMITHRNVVNLAHAHLKRWEGLTASRVLQFASFSFDGSVWEFVTAWIRGATLVLAPKEQMLQGDALTALINREAVDIATLPPSALAVLSPESLPNFKTVISAGEALTVAQITPWLKGRRVMNGYGPTESTVDASVGDLSGNEPITIGRPIPNIAFYLLDTALQPVPIGVTGEIYIGGEGLARGYLNRPGLTAERFLPNPFEADGSRMYRTGDLARYRPDGNVEILGRADHQVKVRGFRIELGEIEATLARHPSLAQALVIASGEGESKRLIAYYVPKVTTVGDGGTEAAAAPELRRFLKQTLPAHMVPALFVSLSAFPLNPSGKIDRRALPAADDVAAFAREYAPPRTPTEQALAGIWQQVLHVPRVDVHDNFFEIGGHSLLATQAVSRINDTWSLALPVRALFEAPDIESLARLTDRAQASGRIARLPLVPIERGGALPVSFAQQRLWFLSKLEGPSFTYNLSVVMHLRGSLDQEALVRALQTIVERHEVLRTRFAEIDGAPVQLIDPASDFVVRRHRPPTPDAAAALVDQELYYPFEINRDALFHALLIEEGPDAHGLVLNAHHSVSDGWSLGVMMKELTALYTAFCAGHPSPLDPLPIQYADFAHWQREWLSGDVLAAETEYWKSALANLPPLLDLPTDRPRPPVQTYRGAHERFRPSKALSDQLIALSQKSGATLFMTLLAAFDILLGRYSGQTDIAVGTPVANRSRPELEPLVGFFINNLVLRCDLSGNPTFTALLEQVREVALNAYAHQDVPFEYLVGQLNPARSLSYAPLFQVMLVMQNAPFSAVRLPNLDVTLVHHTQPTTKFDLVFSLSETPDGISGWLEYSTDLFDQGTIERLLDHYRRLLEAIVANPEERIGAYELLSEHERRQVLVEWNRNQQSYPQDQTLHGLFEERAEKTPDAIALVFEDKHLSYGALNARANQLAHYLVSLGVGLEARVGLCVERSLDMVIAILGVLKAGGAYIPFDPTYPKSRLDYILEDTQARCVITRLHLRDRIGDGVEVVCLDEVRSSIAQQSDAQPIVPLLSAQNLAYVIHTSGSTGRPKGVMITHRNVINLAYAHKKRFANVPGSRFLQFASFSFDGAVWEFVTTWMRGATLVLAPRERMLPGPALTDLMNREAVDIAVLPPSALAVLSPESLPALKVLISAGEALSPTQVTPWLQGRIVLNGYGPTESTVDASIGEVDGDEPITIGRPIPNIGLYILDRALQPVPIGIRGELYIAGDGLARGYLNRPGLTAEKFLPNPFGAAGMRMYRTGDLARYRTDGKVEFLGRADHQVKIRGFRVERGEIEAALALHPAIAQALVIASGEGESNRLIAYYTLKSTPVGEEEGPAAPEWRRFLKQTLPEHMVPGFFVRLDAFPVTPNGKIDHAALPLPDVAGVFAKQYAPPRTLTEQAMARVWQQVLNVPQVGVHDNFFELGGHSLLVVQLITRIKQVLDVEVPLIELYQHPTIAGLAAQLTRNPSGQASQRGVESAESPLVLLSARDTGAPLVVIPGVVGVLTGYFDLAQAMGRVRPVYGLHGLSAPEAATAHTIEGIAQLYVSSLRDVWDEGPLHIFGHSYGGIVAFEMVKQLERQGREVTSLILADADPRAMNRRDLTPNAFVLRHIGPFLGLDEAAIADAVRRVESADREELTAVLHAFLSKGDAGASFGRERIRDWVYMIQSRYVAAHAPTAYKPAARVLKVWAENGALRGGGGGEGSSRDVEATWLQTIQKKTDRIIVPGDHETLISREHIPRLAGELNDWIDKKPGGSRDGKGELSQLSDSHSKRLNGVP